MLVFTITFLVHRTCTQNVSLPEIKRFGQYFKNRNSVAIVQAGAVCFFLQHHKGFPLIYIFDKNQNIYIKPETEIRLNCVSGHGEKETIG